LLAGTRLVGSRLKESVLAAKHGGNAIEGAGMNMKYEIAGIGTTTSKAKGRVELTFHKPCLYDICFG
jgi:hypothetical protein